MFFVEDLIGTLGLAKDPNVFRATNSNQIRVQVLEIKTLKRKIRKEVREKRETYSKFSKTFNSTLDKAKSGFITSKALTTVNNIGNGIQELEERVLSFSSNSGSHNRIRNIG